MKKGKFKILACLFPIIIFFALTAYCAMQYLSEIKLQSQLNNIEIADSKIQKTLKPNKYGYSDVMMAIESNKQMQFINFKSGDINNKGSIDAIIKYNGDISSLNTGLENLLSKDNFKKFKVIDLKNIKGNIQANIEAEFIQ